MLFGPDSQWNTVIEMLLLTLFQLSHLEVCAMINIRGAELWQVMSRSLEARNLISSVDNH